MKKSAIILNGIIKENPTFALFLGMCPVLATSSSFYSAIGMSVCVFLVLLLSNITISLVSRITPDEIRIPVYIIIIATIVSVISMLVEAFANGIYSVLGSYLQLIVVNCIILGRAESFANKNTVVDSIMDAIGISIGFLIAMSCVSLIREIVGTGHLTFCNLEGKQIFDTQIIADGYEIGLLSKPAGAFLVLGICVAGFYMINNTDKKNLKWVGCYAGALVLLIIVQAILLKVIPETGANAIRIIFAVLIGLLFASIFVLLAFKEKLQALAAKKQPAETEAKAQ